MNKITNDELQVLAKYIFEISGIHLEMDKGYLLETRLTPLLQSQGCASYSELYYRARADRSGELKQRIIEAISTNETFFFRDNTPFELMRNKIVPELIDRRGIQYGHGKIPLRIWSAACSTGQEVYSIAITLLEMLPDLGRYEITILGTDISDKVIAQASYGKYNKFEIERGLSLAYRHKYFTPLGEDWRVKDQIRVMAQFRKINLMKPFTELEGRFDLIFCRNVAIYFAQADKINLFQKLARVLQPDGALLVGGSETISAIAPDFEVCRYLRGVYYQPRRLAGNVVVAPVREVAPPRPQPPPPPVAVPVRPVRAIPATLAPPAAVLPPPVAPPAAPPREVSAPPSAPSAAAAGKTSLLASLRTAKEPPSRAVAPAGAEKTSLLAKLREKKRKE